MHAIPIPETVDVYPYCVDVVSTLVAVPDGFAVGAGRDASWPGRPHAQRDEHSRCRILSHRYLF